MEILIIALVLGGVIKYGVTDLVHAAKGTPNARYEAAKARSAGRTARVEARAGRKSGRGRTGGPGPLRCYLSTLWADAWTDATARHIAKRVKPAAGDGADSAGRPERPRGAARVFLGGLTGDLTRGVRRRWERAWTRAEERRQASATRLRPDTVVVPGETVDPATPAAEPTPETPSSPESPSSSSGEDGPTDPPTVVREDPVCVICDGSREWDGRPCPACVRPSPQEYDPADRSGHDYDGPTPVRRLHPIEDAMPNPVSTNPTAPTGAPTNRKVIDMSSLSTTDLSNLDQVDSEVSNAARAFVVLIEAQNEAREWAQNLPDRWAASDFDTAGLRAAIAAVSEGVQHGVNADSLAALDRVQVEIKEARSVGEVADAADASGNVGSFRAS